MQAERSGGQMMAGKSPGGGEMGRMQQETRRGRGRGWRRAMLRRRITGEKVSI